jgi:hypothetical protein
VSGSADGSLSERFVDVLPVNGAAVSTIGGLADAETIDASDDDSARIDEAQLDLKEGPCWEAAASRDWVLVFPFASEAQTRWPAFTEAVKDIPVGGIYSMPLSVGNLVVGVADLWTEHDRGLPSRQRRDAEVLGQEMARDVLRHTLHRLEQVIAETDDGGPRAIIHQATGMVMAQLDIDPTESATLLRARAFADGRPLRSVAEDVVARRLDFAGGDE